MNILLKLTVVIGLGTPQVIATAMPKCEALAAATPTKLIQFLSEGQSGSPDPHCVEYALRRLGDEKVHQAIPVLASYLGFQRPETEREKMGIGGALGTIGNDFPASYALSQIRQDALPALVHVIETAESGTQPRQNGIYTIVRIFHNGVAAIGFLKHTASSAPSRDAQDRLSGAARDAAIWCSPAERPSCESAASSAPE